MLAGDEVHSRLRDCVVAFCADIGLGLDLPLYRDAFAHLAQCSRNLVPLRSAEASLGHHEMTLLNEHVAIAVTALADTDDFRIHL